MSLDVVPPSRREPGAITVVIPSRGRPDRAFIAADAALSFATVPSTRVVIVIDDDDPALPLYLRRSGYPARGWSRLVLSGGETGDLVRATNTASRWLAADRPSEIIGNLGDDHVVRTPGWDAKIAAALATPGIAYGDDRLQGEHLPTAPFISAEIVRALGWYALPTCRHMYIDDAWKALGNELGILRYLPDVIIEHVHPATGAVPTDEGYERANASTKHDADAFFAWRNGTDFRDDLRAVRRVL